MFATQFDLVQELSPASQVADSVFVQTDSLALLPADSTLFATLKEVVQDTVSVADVFGGTSYIPISATSGGETFGLFAEDVVYQLIVTGLFLLYFLLVFRYGSEIVQFLRLAWRKGTDKDRRTENDSPAAQVQAGLTLCGLLMLGVAAVRLDEILGIRLLSLLPFGGVWSGVLAVVLAAFAVVCLQEAILQISGSLTFSSGFVKMLLLLRRAFFASVTVIATPVVLLMALSSGMWVDIFAWGFVGIVGLHALFYIAMSFFLFVAQKVSILFWILYLCTVEAMPVGILLVSALRCMSA